MSEPTNDTQGKKPEETRRGTPRPIPRGMPRVADRKLGPSMASIALHGAAILLLFLPSFADRILSVDENGAGGPGPVGGGGGGHRGTGGSRDERVQYVAAKPVPIPPPIVPPIIPPVEVKKPEVVPPPVVTPPEPVKADSTPPKVATSTEAKAPVTGVGGGTGNDGTDGTGPGRGGGTGSGIGTGRGSGVGPGTGGGSGTVYKASVTTLVLLPMPIPAKVKPYQMTACFEVDSLGRQRLLDWTRSKDDGYNRKVEESLKGYKFRPAVRLDGTPVRDTTCVNARGG